MQTVPTPPPPPGEKHCGGGRCSRERPIHQRAWDGGEFTWNKRIQQLKGCFVNEYRYDLCSVLFIRKSNINEFASISRRLNVYKCIGVILFATALEYKRCTCQQPFPVPCFLLVSSAGKKPTVLDAKSGNPSIVIQKVCGKLQPMGSDRV